MDLSGYGASIFSDWLNPHAAIAETSQAKFEVYVGAAHRDHPGQKHHAPVGDQGGADDHPLPREHRLLLSLRQRLASRERRLLRFHRRRLRDRRRRSWCRNDAARQILDPPGVCAGLFDVRRLHATDEIEPFTKFGDLNPKIVDGMAGTRHQPETDPVPYDCLAAGFLQRRHRDRESGQRIRHQDDRGQRTKAHSIEKILGFVQLAPRGLPLIARRNSTS